MEISAEWPKLLPIFLVIFDENDVLYILVKFESDQ